MTKTFAERFRARFPDCDPQLARYLICLAEFIVGDGAVPAAVAKPLLDTAGKHIKSLQESPRDDGYERTIEIARDTPSRAVKSPKRRGSRKSSRKTAPWGKRRS